MCFCFVFCFLHVFLSLLFIIYTSREELVTCGNSDLNKSMRILALPIAMSMATISNSCDSVFGRNVSLKCLNTCSSNIPIILPRTFSSYTKCSVSCLVWSNFMSHQYVHCCNKVFPHELNLFINFSFKPPMSCMLSMTGSNQFYAIYVNINANMFLNSINALMLPCPLWEVTYILNASQCFLLWPQHV